jgi:hypothetical protein
MKRKWMKKLSAISVGTILLLALLSSQAFAWGSATHAYIDDRLGKQGPLKNLNEIYGGMAPDVFNYLFQHPDWLEYLYMETHYENNIVLWKKANTPLEKAVAFGFVSHNGVTGADATAHGTYDYSLEKEPTGWVIAKAVEMAEREDVHRLLTRLGLANDQGVSYVGYELCHTFVESAVDLLLAQQDRSLGGKISAAALARTREFPDLLIQSYARKFAKKFGLEYATAVQTIRSAESEFRKNTVLYGLALAQAPETARDLIVEQLIALAPAFLAAYGAEVELPGYEELKAICDYLIDVAIDVCDEDYLVAVQKTIQYVSTNLPHLGRWY